MQKVDGQPFSRVVVAAPRTRVEVALPNDVPMVDLLPTLLDMVGERGSQAPGDSGWQLATLERGMLDPGASLRSCGVLDGTVLQLRSSDADVHPPVFDDVIDAIATEVRQRHDARPIVSIAAVASIGVLVTLACLGLVWSPDTPFTWAVSLAGAVASFIAATAVGKGSGQGYLAATLGLSSIALAVVTGIAAVPHAQLPMRILLGAVLGLLVSLVAPAVMKTGLATYSGSTCALAITTVCFLGATVSTLGSQRSAAVVHIAAALVCVAVAAMTVLPRMVVRLAHLPLPFVPTSTQELTDADTTIDLDEVTYKSAMADEYLVGSTLGCAVVAAAASGVLVQHHTWPAAVLGLLGLGVLFLRTRSLPHRSERLGVALAALAALTIGGGWHLATQQGSRFVLYVAGAAIVAAIVVAIRAAAARDVRPSPMTARTLDLIDGIAITALIPLAAWVMNLYSMLRHWPS